MSRLLPPPINLSRVLRGIPKDPRAVLRAGFSFLCLPMHLQCSCWGVGTAGLQARTCCATDSSLSIVRFANRPNRSMRRYAKNLTGFQPFFLRVFFVRSVCLHCEHKRIPRVSVRRPRRAKNTGARRAKLIDHLGQSGHSPLQRHSPRASPARGRVLGGRGAPGRRARLASRPPARPPNRQSAARGAVGEAATAAATAGLLTEQGM